MILRLFFIFLLAYQFSSAQIEVSKDYFSNPLNIDIELSGTFGELRSNHFHSGLDIRTQQKEGLPVFAPEDGYVSRIKVSHFGYGKALYIQHLNGYSTVYAHLKDYAGAIQDHVKKAQYRQQSFEIELFPERNVLHVKKGDLIGYTGNTGSSGGPHLHFEIRDANAKPMNPLQFGIEVNDTRKPLINSVFVYPISEDAHANQDANPKQLKLIPQKDGSYLTEKIAAFGTIGFGVSAIDQQSGAANRNGVYKIETSYNGETSLVVQFDKFSFDETRYINRYVDYRYFMDKRTSIQKLFIEKNNPLSIFKTSKDQGFITVLDSLNGVYRIVVSDYNKNSVEIVVPIQGKKLPILNKKPEAKFTHTIIASENNQIQEGKFSIYIPKDALYEDAHIQVQAVGDSLKFHADVIPVHNNMTIQADASHYRKEDFNKLYLAKLNAKGQPSYISTNKQGTTLSGKTRNFGTYAIVLDNESPVISPVNFEDGKWISANKTLDIKITDSLSGIKSYRAEINGKWILMEYEHKKNLLTYNFEDAVSTETEHKLKVIVTDNVGNSSKFEATFYRK